MGFFKDYQLRWIFYRKVKNFRFNNKSYECSDACSECGNGVNGGLSFYGDVDPDRRLRCMRCGKKYNPIPNKNISRKLFKIFKRISNVFWDSLSFVRIVRSSVHGRYEFGGDECRYVSVFSIPSTGKESFELKNRRWFEYVFIKK